MKKRIVAIALLFSLTSAGLIAAKVVTLPKVTANVWDVLMKVKWVKKYDKKSKTTGYAPKFTKEIQALNGKQITIKGYLIPVDLYGDGSFAVISALPVDNCFFCGGAGPETVMEVYTNQKVKAGKSGKVTFRGKLELNPSDADHLIYILREATIL